jgi:hypothetical protein
VLLKDLLRFSGRCAGTLGRLRCALSAHSRPQFSLVVPVQPCALPLQRDTPRGLVSQFIRKPRTMNKNYPVLAGVVGSLQLLSCSLPRQQSTLMEGKVRGGDVPLYVMGDVSDFTKAGLFLPSVHRYLRTQYEVLDVAANGDVTPALEGVSDTVRPTAQLAIPLLVSTYDLPKGYEARFALAPEDELRSTSSLVFQMDPIVASQSSVRPPKAEVVEDAE